MPRRRINRGNIPVTRTVNNVPVTPRPVARRPVRRQPITTPRRNVIAPPTPAETMPITPARPVARRRVAPRVRPVARRRRRRMV